MIWQEGVMLWVQGVWTQNKIGQIKKRKKRKRMWKKESAQKASLDSDDEDKEIEETLNEFFFMAIEEERDEEKDDIQQAFEDLYKDLIILSKKNKEPKDMMESIGKENKKLEDKVASMVKDLEKSPQSTKISRTKIRWCSN